MLRGFVDGLEREAEHGIVILSEAKNLGLVSSGRGRQPEMFRFAQQDKDRLAHFNLNALTAMTHPLEQLRDDALREIEAARDERSLEGVRVKYSEKAAASPNGATG